MSEGCYVVDVAGMKTPCDAVVEAERRIAELEEQRARLDCRYAGTHADMSGSHCLVETPCDRCKYEKRIAELKSELKNLHKLATKRRKAIEIAMRYCDRETFDELQEALGDE